MATYNLTIYPSASRPYRIKNLTGQRFGRLLVLGFGGIRRRETMWHCLCDCGNTTTVKGVDISRQHTQSCGCFRKESASQRRFIHGESVSLANTVEYRCYMAAKSRCTNPNDISYRYYGGKGIEFRFQSYAEFLDELGRKPSPDLSIERINTKGHYERGNVKWGTDEEQANNKTNNRLITALNKTQTVMQWSRETGFTRKAITNRIDKHGWCEECAVTLRPRWDRCPHRQGFETYKGDYAQRRDKWNGPVKRQRLAYKESQR